MLRFAIDRLLDHGDSTLQVAIAMNCRSYKPRRAPRWTGNNIRRLIADASLCGDWVWARPGRKETRQQAIQLTIPAIVSAERAAAVKHRLQATATVRVRNNSYLLRRKRLIGPCGNHFFGVYSSSAKRTQYRCYGSINDNARQLSIKQRCECRRIDADSIEQLVKEQICTLLSDDEALESLLKQYRSQLITAAQSIDRSAEKRLASIEKALEQAYRQRFESTIDPFAINAVIKDYEGEIADLRNSIDTANNSESGLDGVDSLLRDVVKLKELATSHLWDLPVSEFSELVNMMDVKVTVLEWKICSHCMGTGRVTGVVGKLGGSTCGRCLGMKTEPSVQISGTVFSHWLRQYRERRHHPGSVSR